VCGSAMYVLCLPQGSLRSALNQYRLVDPSLTGHLPAVHLVLSLAHDIACAMLHLHLERIVHGDLKASNVLLTKGSTGFECPATSVAAAAAASLSVSAAEAIREVLRGSDGKTRTGPKPGSCAALLSAAQRIAGGRLVAKIADFGLSLALDPASSHISQIHSVSLCWFLYNHCNFPSSTVGLREDAPPPPHTHTHTHTQSPPPSSSLYPVPR
jgi:serine/threonine protein kinase